VNILLIQLKRIGDLILTTPAIAALRTKFPDANLTLVISHECAAMVPALPAVDHVIVMRRGLGDFKNFLSVFRRRFDYCIDFTRSDRSASLTFLSGAAKRIVSARLKRKRIPLRRRAYNEFVPYRMRDMHTIDYHLSLLLPLGISDASDALRLKLPAKVQATAHDILDEADVGARFAVFHPGSARTEKFWEPERWAELIEHARNQWKLDCVLTGGTAALEQQHLEQIKKRVKRPANEPKLVDLSGKTDLLTLGAVISRARLLVTVDSAPVHFAAAAGTPQVILFGPTNPFHWRPRNGPAIVLQGNSRTPATNFVARQAPSAMNLISTRAAIDAMDSLLSTPT
jgi:predicted lipopolysaccharide heptosyltransferase III